MSAAEAFRAHLAELGCSSPAIDALAARVESFAPDHDGARAGLRGGGAIVWSGGLRYLWAYLDAEAEEQNDHHLAFGDDSGPPDGDAVLDGTAYQGAEVGWFLQEMPWDRYWFEADDGVHAYDFDGGLADVLPPATPIREVLFARIVARLASLTD